MKKCLHSLMSCLPRKNLPWKLKEILPKVLVAGKGAGRLTEEGARLLDPTGNLKAGIPLCPPEGNAGTGMTATNCVAKKCCNVSAGTSVFAMVVLEDELSKVHKEIDLVMTPAGDPVAIGPSQQLYHGFKCLGSIYLVNF